MNFQGQVVLVYLEEDNIAKAYFRIKPLMTQEGPIGETKDAFPDDGFLRIVPDRNEQHTFKERMRGMCGLCMIDLRNLPPEANKIRTNKNYSPTRGETNQYIIYSDAVRALPDDLLFQVVPDGALPTASTAQVYIRNGANIQGPFLRENGQAVGETAPLQPDSPEIHAVTVNGQDLLFYWPRCEAPAAPQAEEAPKEEAPAPAAEADQPDAPAAADSQPAPEQSAYDAIQALNVAPSATANRLREPAGRTPMDFIPEQPQRPLIGTRLYQTPQKQPPARRAHNALMETVERERYVGRYEAPSATLCPSVELKEVHNPADSLKRALSSMWQTQEGKRQAVDVVLAHSGMRAMLAKVVSQEANDLTVAAMHSQLQELEAERLMTLMQLDDVKKNLAAAREEALGKLTASEQKKLDEIKAQEAAAQANLDALTGKLDSIRQEAEAHLAALQGDLAASQRCIIPQSGQDADKAELIRRVDAALKAAGFAVEEGDAEALLTAYALCENELSFYADAEEDSYAAIQAFAGALGVEAQDRGPAAEAVILPGGDAPVMLVGYQNRVHPLLTSCLHTGAQDRKEGLYVPSFPEAPFYPSLDALPEKAPVCAPVSKAAIIREMTAGASELNDDTKAVILSLRRAMADKRTLPLKAVSQLCRFIACTQDSLKGGVAEAIDRAVCLYAVPYMIGLGKQLDEIKPLMAAMPRALKALNA